MKRRAASLVEILVASGLVAVIAGALFAGFGTFTRQSSRASERLWQTQEALLLLDGLHRELSGMVMNPVADPRLHQGNSFLISQPNGTSIQFVTEIAGTRGPERRLIYYEARTAPPGSRGALALKKEAWIFRHHAPWTQVITFPPGWPSDWLGPAFPNEEARWRRLGIEDMRYEALLPQSGQPELFIRVKLTLRDAEGGGLLPFTTLVGIPLPPPATDVSACPCLNAPCFDPAHPDCGCCESY